MANIRFLGATGEVTGSCYLIEHKGLKILVDCGLYQGHGDEEKNRQPFLFDPKEINAVLVTHAHLDHTGRIPLLVKDGFKGPIYATTPTCELTDILWHDTVKLMKEEAEWRTRKNLRAGKPPVRPLYELEHVKNALSLLHPVQYDDMFDVSDSVRVRFRDAGHILGSACIEVWLLDEESTVKIVFSGDIGPSGNAMEGMPSVIESADFVVMESTYGDRRHKTLDETRKEFEGVIKESISSGGKVLIPSFVVDRAQRIMYELMLLREKGVLPSSVPIYFDSPMGKLTTDVYKKHESLLSGEIQEYILKNKDPFSLPNLHYVSTVDDSRAINNKSHAIVIAGSGMCSGGRILHHLKHNLWKESTHVIFVGYQARGTLGRRLIEGATKIKIMGEEVKVAASIHTINGFSAHADCDDLLKWAKNFKTNPLFMITHGEPHSSNAFANSLKENGFKALVPFMGQKIELLPNIDESLTACSTTKQISDSVKNTLSEIITLAKQLSTFDESLASKYLALLESSKVLLQAAKEKIEEENTY